MDTYSGISLFTFNQTATYCITYNIQIAYVGTGVPPFTTFRFIQGNLMLINETPIDGTRHNLELGFQATTLSKSFLIHVSTGDNITLQWDNNGVSNTDLVLQTFASPDGATTSSVSICITRIN